ncbi:MAG TPA: hypothetical protein VGN75_00700, partial [Kaistia sp.]|nr:hypothetical protein [Kaistia sp.]
SRAPARLASSIRQDARSRDFHGGGRLASGGRRPPAPGLIPLRKQVLSSTKYQLTGWRLAI